MYRDLDIEEGSREGVGGGCRAQGCAGGQLHERLRRQVQERADARLQADDARALGRADRVEGVAAPVEDDAGQGGRRADRVDQRHRTRRARRLHRQPAASARGHERGAGDRVSTKKSTRRGGARVWTAPKVDAPVPVGLFKEARQVNAAHVHQQVGGGAASKRLTRRLPVLQMRQRGRWRSTQTVRPPTDA